MKQLTAGYLVFVDVVLSKKFFSHQAPSLFFISPPTSILILIICAQTSDLFESAWRHPCARQSCLAELPLPCHM